MALPSSAVSSDPQSQEPDVPVLKFPLGWLTEHASPAIVYRSYVEVAQLQPPAGFEYLPLQIHTALRIAVCQSLDGTWDGSMLDIPPDAGVEGVGTIPAVRRLLEYGWDRDTPTLALARRILFRLLAEDDDPHYLFEFRNEATSRDTAVRARNILREAASSVLARAGYEADPRLRGAARRVLERNDAFLDSALAEKPWVRIGNRHVLSADASPPSIYALTMLAHMPIVRSEHFPQMERLFAYLSQPKPTQEAVQLYGKEVIMQPHLVLGDLLHNRHAVEQDIPFALFWLETMARLNFLKRNETWFKLFTRFVDDCDRTGVWHPRKGETPSTTNPYTWPMFPLEERLDGEARWTDITFRIGVIARVLGWRIELV